MAMSLLPCEKQTRKKKRKKNNCKQKILKEIIAKR